jgi:CheY-like chemotaxis protein
MPQDLTPDGEIGRPWTADQGQQVLLVDDYPLGRKLLALKLRQAGFRVTTASSGEEALKMARQSPPDAIISDIRMTGMDGFELCEAVRGDPRLGDIPVLLLSSAVEQHEQRRANASRCLLCTSDLHEALEVLSTTLRKHRLESG